MTSCPLHFGERPPVLFKECTPQLKWLEVAVRTSRCCSLTQHPCRLLTLFSLQVNKLFHQLCLVPVSAPAGGSLAHLTLLSITNRAQPASPTSSAASLSCSTQLCRPAPQRSLYLAHAISHGLQHVPWDRQGAGVLVPDATVLSVPR